MTRTARWYFDVISPFSYLHLKQFDRLPHGLAIECVPVLFAGLLKHWGQRGPAEIPAKRVQTYRGCVWTAARLGIPFRMPPAHPFNPLAALRLLCALDARRDAVEVAFEFVWSEGRNLESPEDFQALAQRLGVEDAGALIARREVKERLLDNTRAAAARGVYGVPTFDIGGELFWGSDMLDMMNDFIADPGLFDTPEMRRVSTLPLGTARPS